ncbi:response regulator transcription factor [Larkinella humicola]|uniref:Response regulator transcription factor n=1 Tax=Larkinella humicola TaxID=2607654 RepID=A0A5N1JNA3_9BACT|nr:response regulator transcription factor [Larkinella humicola]
MLLPLLQDPTQSPEYKYHAALLLSYTYKRVFDYQSALKFLTVALGFARETPNRNQYEANIIAEQAFVYFDVHNYTKADSLIKRLTVSGFRFINPENKAILVMQQGYLFFLNRQFSKADDAYDRAIAWMQISNPCNLPMIYVKKVQLYDAMNREERMMEALRKSTGYADSCRIIKYHLYAYEELLKIFEKRNDASKIVEIKAKIDSLNQIYAREENISLLHDQKESILLKTKEQELLQQKTSRDQLTLVLSGLTLIALLLLSGLLFYRQRQNRLEAEFLQMKAEMDAYITLNGKVQADNTTNPGASTGLLSERQREVFQCMTEGLSNKAIADKLCISENTVKYHIKNIYQVLEIKDRKDLLVYIRK